MYCYIYREIYMDSILRARQVASSRYFRDAFDVSRPYITSSAALPPNRT